MNEIKIVPMNCSSVVSMLRRSLSDLSKSKKIPANKGKPQPWRTIPVRYSHMSKEHQYQPAYRRTLPAQLVSKDPKNDVDLVV